MLLERLGRRGGLRRLPYRLWWRVQHRLGQGVHRRWRLPHTHGGAGGADAAGRPGQAIARVHNVFNMYSVCRVCVWVCVWVGGCFFFAV